LHLKNYFYFSLNAFRKSFFFTGPAFCFVCGLVFFSQKAPSLLCSGEVSGGAFSLFFSLSCFFSGLKSSFFLALAFLPKKPVKPRLGVVSRGFGFFLSSSCQAFASSSAVFLGVIAAPKRPSVYAS